MTTNDAVENPAAGHSPAPPGSNGGKGPPSELTLADWRREVLEIYRDVRNLDDPARAHALWRRRRDRLFREHPQSPLGLGDPMRRTGLPYWSYRPDLRFELAVLPIRSGPTYSITTGADETTKIRQIGSIELPHPAAGKLAVWWLEQYGGGIFIPFRDATAGSSTYGAGRYLLDTAKGADLGARDGMLTVDFNFSYHPSCRYDPAWQCPLAPPENTITVPIQAGEKLSL